LCPYQPSPLAVGTKWEKDTSHPLEIVIAPACRPAAVQGMVAVGRLQEEWSYPHLSRAGRPRQAGVGVRDWPPVRDPDRSHSRDLCGDGRSHQDHPFAQHSHRPHAGEVGPARLMTTNYAPEGKETVGCGCRKCRRPGAPGKGSPTVVVTSPGRTAEHATSSRGPRPWRYRTAAAQTEVECLSTSVVAAQASKVVHTDRSTTVSRAAGGRPGPQAVAGGCGAGRFLRNRPGALRNTATTIPHRPERRDV
jgi:hypothetical protein